MLLSKQSEPHHKIFIVQIFLLIMEFPASVDKDGKLIVKPFIEKKVNENGGTDITVHLPSPLQIKAVAEEIKDGKRSIQSVQSKLNE